MTVGGNVVDAAQFALDHKDHRRSEIIEVKKLRRHVVLTKTSTHSGGERTNETRGSVGGHGRYRSENT